MASFSNAEGEDHLRQRRLQLPFGFTTGEALLYETGPTLDIASRFSELGSFSSKDKEDVDPKSLLGYFLSQDKNIYAQTVEPTVPEDQVFTDTWALLNVPSKIWQGDQPVDSTGGPAPVKAEAEQSVVAMIDTLEKMAQDGGLCEALQSLEVNAAELMEWENALMKLSQDNDQQNDTTSELDSILTNDIFAYMDSVLFKEANLNTSQPACLATVPNNQDKSFGQAVQPSTAGMCEPQLFQRPSTDHTQAAVNGLCAQQQGINNGPVSTGQTLAQPAQIFNSTQKLSHYGPPVLQSDASVPSLQQLQLEDIFSPSIELPELNLPAISGNDVPFESRGQVSVNHMACQQGIPGQTQSNQLQQFSLSDMQTPPVAANGQLLQSCVPQPNSAAPSAAPSVLENLPSLIPCNDFSSPNESSTQRAPIPFPTACLQGNAPFQTHNNHRIQQWPHTQQQKLPPASVTQNGHKPIPACHSQVPSSQRFPPAGIWPRSINGVNHTQQGGLADGQAAPPSSCMFEKHSLPLPNGTGVTPSSSTSQRGNDGPLDQSPTQASCYFQVGRSEPVVGTSVIIQENASISPPSHPLQLGMSSPQDLLVMQSYLEYNEQTQVTTSTFTLFATLNLSLNFVNLLYILTFSFQQNSRLPAESNGLFAVQPLGDINMYFPEQTQTNCCNF